MVSIDLTRIKKHPLSNPFNPNKLGYICASKCYKLKLGRIYKSNPGLFEGTFINCDQDRKFSLNIFNEFRRKHIHIEDITIDPKTT